VTSFLNAKDGNGCVKRKNKIEPQGRKPEFGLREATIFIAPKLLAFNDLASKNN
jgi:hypothetical protein